jgi:predicted alpha-1,2-mannosidase
MFKEKASIPSSLHRFLFFDQNFMKKPSSFLIPLMALQAIAPVAGAADALVHLANPLQGTDSVHAFSHGNTYPAVATPFPMNKWAPYTQPAKDPFFYQYRQNQIRGIRQTHQPSPWIGDYAAFSLMAVSGKLAVNENDRASVFQHEKETAQPAYYSVRLDTWDAVMEVTPTERAARFRFTFEKPGDSWVVLDAFPGGSSVEIIPSENKVIGITRYNRGGVPENFANYFVIIFDRPFSEYGVWTPDSTQPGVKQLAADHVGAFLKFDTSKNGVVECRVASSFISAEQAMRNLESEIGDADFDTVRQRAEARWNEAMGRIKVEGGTEEQRRTFYSAMYRNLLFPHKFYELNEAGKPVHYSPYDGRLHDGHLYTDTGYWDTFRASHPLYNLLFPEVSAEVLQGVINAYNESGWLPAWSSPGHRDCMIGNHAFSLLADGWAKGIRSFDAQKAVDAMVHDANAEGPLPAVGRKGAKFYNELGYVPFPEVKESTARTMEYAYNDWCAAQLARAVGRDDDAATFEKTALNYRNVFDAKTGFVRGRNADGSWREPFDPTEWGGPFTEGNAWHWTWSVFHNVPDLIQLLGGDEAFVAKLEGVFNTPNTVNVGSYGKMIHEMTEMVATNLGQYAHGNQPIQHALYLYNYAGQPWLTQSRVRQVMHLLYQPTPDGLCGDEDTGQMSAWYIFSALGFYPVTPGDTNYIIGSPLFDRVTLMLPGGKEFVISAEKNGPQRPYIQSATLNGKEFNRTFIDHSEIVRGGELKFEMGSAPNYEWGTAPESRPPALMPPAGGGKDAQ